MKLYDVIVVGKGNAALSAALSARDQGRRDSVTLCGRVRERRRAPVLEPLRRSVSASARHH